MTVSGDWIKRDVKTDSCTGDVPTKYDSFPARAVGTKSSARTRSASRWACPA
jgi:hypothetical protein